MSVFSQPRMYADDTSLAFSGADLKHIDDYLKGVVSWDLSLLF